MGLSSIEDVPATPEYDAAECPLCGYDLRGLPANPGNRCPECGHVYDLEAIRQAKIDRSSWFYENVERRQARAFWITSLKSLRPIRFWRDVKPTMPIVKQRLDRFAGIWVTLINATAIVATVLGASVILASARGQPTATFDWLTNLLRGGMTTESPYRYASAGTFGVLDAVKVFLLHQSSAALLRVVPVILLWPLVARAAVELFGITIRRAAIHPAQLWRCVVYPLPALVVLFVSLTIHRQLDPRGMSDRLLTGGRPSYLEALLSMCGQSVQSLDLLVLVFTATTFHLVSSHLFYLRLPMAFAQAILVQLVTWLTLFTGGYLVTSLAS